ncbi:pentatricopeptide repeat-containing protein At4g18975, chloroplastic isoform X2 [Humulus lupulus]|uniref:pentatricopeptide repeat-containing protein At4g18975, chloroplastic isoform X2 n=1 Tax=Humulus lupulus TaxID=3486 RepID=UPI002B417100|nr:pentatricopeptide repeat-containing protein At4g18975, chloroplastic isoform X2 [Humulus lupulus]
MVNATFLSSGYSIGCHFYSSSCKISKSQKEIGFLIFAAKANPSHGKLVMSSSYQKRSSKFSGEPQTSSKAIEKRTTVKKAGKREHHLWKKRDSAGSGQKALNLIRIISDLPNEKEVVYGALNKWIAWETEFPLIAAAKALRILRKRSQWKRVIQVAKWMLSKGQGATMGTYDTLLLAFDMDQRIDEAEALWNMILHTHKRSISKQLFSRMISLYNHHGMKDKIIEIIRYLQTWRNCV